ncbi:MAG: tyrosine-type recombinase/integrase [Anaerolineaceae bacterium]|nr:tyrosine-type recombinase/integrase [Anaerolineaceae bacterium]
MDQTLKGIQKIKPESISAVIEEYLDNLALNSPRRTTITYRTAMHKFLNYLLLCDFDVHQNSIESLNEIVLVEFAQSLAAEKLSASTRRVYLTALLLFIEYVVLDKKSVDLDLEQLRRKIKVYVPKKSQRLPQFNAKHIETVINFCMTPRVVGEENSREQWRWLRDCAFILTLADTGLRVHEACGLRRGEMDWEKRQVIIIGKGNKQAVVRFSTRAAKAIQQYLSARSNLDGSYGKPLSSLPLFARHDKRASKKVLPISTNAGEEIVTLRAGEALQDLEKSRPITPHSFRHYFVTKALKASGNIRVAQRLARHENITTTDIYLHLADSELDDFYDQAFEVDQ